MKSEDYKNHSIHIESSGHPDFPFTWFVFGPPDHEGLRNGKFGSLHIRRADALKTAKDWIDEVGIIDEE